MNFSHTDDESESGINVLFPWKLHVMLYLDCSFCDDGSESLSERFCNCIHLMIDLYGSVDWRGTWFGFMSGGMVCVGCSRGQIGLVPALSDHTLPCFRRGVREEWQGSGLGLGGAFEVREPTVSMVTPHSGS